MVPYIIGIAGGSGSGKTTFARRIAELYPDDVAIVNSDNYYLPHDEISIEERAKLNYDSPEAFEFTLMSEQIASLRNGEAVDCPVYDFSVHTRSSEFIRIEPRPVILIDGILIFHDRYLRSLMDLRIFVEADADERILRRARRDMLERERSIDSVIAQYLATVKPMHNLYVEPAKAYADIIINGGLGTIPLDLICTKINSITGK